MSVENQKLAERTGLAMGGINTTCQECAQPCDTFQEVSVGYGTQTTELWCWCRKCNVQTFHPLSLNADSAAKSQPIP